MATSERIAQTASHLAKESLFAPMTLRRGPAWPNRFMLAPLTNTQSYPDGKLSDNEYNWLTLRAKGGHGLVMTCAAHVQRIGQGFPGQLGVWDDAHIPGLKRLADGIRQYGAVSSVQLHHAGIRSPSELIGQNPVGPSDDAATKSRGLTLAEVEQLKEDFIAGAVRAEKAGFDGVELHGAHGYILCAFISPELNVRTDTYGGPVDGRFKILFDIIAGIRARCSPNFQLGVRISPERFGLKMPEQLDLARRLMALGTVDYLDLSLWDCYKPPVDKEYAHKPLIAWFAELPRNGTRVGVAGRLYDAAGCRRALEEFGMDFVILGRGSILHHDMPKLIQADPEWKAIKTPASKEHLKKEGLSDQFIAYMNESFKGFVAN